MSISLYTFFPLILTIILWTGDYSTHFTGSMGKIEAQGNEVIAQVAQKSKCLNKLGGLLLQTPGFIQHAAPPPKEGEVLKHLFKFSEQLLL